MDIREVKVSEGQRNEGPCGRFTVREPEAKIQVRAGSMMAKLSLCLGVLLIALVLELGGAGTNQQRAVFSSMAGSTLNRPWDAGSDRIGSSFSRQSSAKAPFLRMAFLRACTSAT